jgi:hypothetical protein
LAPQSCDFRLNPNNFAVPPTVLPSFATNAYDSTMPTPDIISCSLSLGYHAHVLARDASGLSAAKLPDVPIDVASVLIASGLIYCQAPTLMWLAKYMMSL